MMGRMTRTRVVAAVATALLLLTGCSGDDRPDKRPGSAEQSQAPVALRLKTVSGGDDLDSRTRAEIEDGIGDVLSSYVVGGFLGDYPRRDFARAFDEFSAGLVGRAGPDLELLTASRFGDADAVRATRLDARVSLAAPDGDVVGASAAVTFDFEASLADGTLEPFGLRGRLLLAHRDGTWTLFGYDVRRVDGHDLRAETS